MVDALDPDHQREATGRDEPSEEEVAAAAKQLLDAAVEPLATNPKLRERLVEVRRSYEQTLDEFSQDKVIAAGYSLDCSDRARQTAESFRAFIEEHKDEITALQILYSRP
jgi:type I restriction enzyme R subunit